MLYLLHLYGTKKIGAIINEKGVSIFCKGGDFMQGLYKLALVGTKQQLTDFLKKVNDNDPDSVFNEYAVEEGTNLFSTI